MRREYTPGQAARFWSKVDKRPDGCWFWVGAVTNPEYPYGQFWLHGRQHLAHRISYEWSVGLVPDGLTLDHLCRNPSCVNPAHLEPVTMRENILRSDGVSANHARKTHCVHGHAFSPDNTYIYPHGGRECLMCRSVHKRAAWARQKARRLEGQT